MSEFTEIVAIKSNAEAKVMFETIHCDDCMSLSFKVMLNYEMEKYMEMGLEMSNTIFHKGDNLENTVSNIN